MGQAVETNGLLEKELKRSNTELVTQGANLAALFTSQKIQMINHVPVHSFEASKEMDSCSAQTDYWQPKVEIITQVQEIVKPKERQ